MTIWTWLKFIQYVIKYVLDKCPEDLKFLEGGLDEESNHRAK
jgi:asparaginyl-tRNA synthetase